MTKLTALPTAIRNKKSFARSFACLWIGIVLAGCGTQVMSVRDGRFDVHSQPLFLNAFSRKDTTSTIDLGAGGFWGAKEEFRSSGLKNKELNDGSVILPESDAQIRYNMLSLNGDLSASFSRLSSVIFGWPGYLGIRLGVLPYLYGELHGGLRYKYGFVGFSGSYGWARNHAEYTSEIATGCWSMGGGCEGSNWDLDDATIDRNGVSHSVVTYGGEISADVGPVVLDYYLGVYKPWASDQLPAYIDTTYTETSDYDISFKFPFLIVQDAAIAYRYQNLRFLSGVRVVASEDLNYFQVGLFGQIAVRM